MIKLEIERLKSSFTNLTFEFKLSIGKFAVKLTSSTPEINFYNYTFRILRLEDGSSKSKLSFKDIIY